MIEFVFVSPVPALFPSKRMTRLGQVLSRALHIKKPSSIGVRFVSLKEMQGLNRNYRKKNTPTDVLAFDPDSIAICAEYAKKEAKRRGIPVEEELLRLLIHGVLHLFGWDHATEKEEEKMFALQEKIVYEVT
ncbi:rRNA maturation RNase YbeY [Candidatus Uhrbacteria bacterium]|nr:rRNA maturation RNase YbeY [Candidatus Uhrbacteria bacterium]